MIAPALLVAHHEIRQTLRRTGFWAALLLLPLAIAGTMGGVRLLAEPPHVQKIVLADLTGGLVSKALADRIERERQRVILLELGRQVAQSGANPVPSGLPIGEQKAWYDDDDLDRYLAAGGDNHAAAFPLLAWPGGRPPVAVQTLPLRLLDLPRDGRGGDPSAAMARLREAIASSGTKPTGTAAYVVYAPADFPARPIEVWTRTPPSPLVLMMLESAAARTILDRAGSGQQQSVSARGVLGPRLVSVHLLPAWPRRGAPGAALLPLLLAAATLASSALSGTWLLINTVEERAAGLLEGLLPCVTANDLVFGKTLAGVGSGLILMLGWGGCAILLLFFSADLVVDAPASLWAPLRTPSTLLVIISAGAIAHAIIALAAVAIASGVDRIKDAPLWLFHLYFLQLVPRLAILDDIVRGIDAASLDLMTWIPFWTPAALIARSGSLAASSELIAAVSLAMVCICVGGRTLARLSRESLPRPARQPLLADLLSPATAHRRR